MFVREYGLVHNASDPERYTRLVKWEGRWTPGIDSEGAYETYSLTPTIWEWSVLDVSNPRALDYSGPVLKLVPTVITEMAVSRWQSVWPTEAPAETETLRRTRIRVLRSVCHVDETKGAAEPQWSEEPARAVA